MHHTRARFPVAFAPRVVVALVAALAGCAMQPATRSGFTSLQAERTQFTRMDRNGDGYLTAGELNPDLRLSREYARWDGDGDSRISFMEFNAYIADVMG